METSELKSSIRKYLAIRFPIEDEKLDVLIDFDLLMKDLVVEEKMKTFLMTIRDFFLGESKVSLRDSDLPLHRKIRAIALQTGKQEIKKK